MTDTANQPARRDRFGTEPQRLLITFLLGATLYPTVLNTTGAGPTSLAEAVVVGLFFGSLMTVVGWWSGRVMRNALQQRPLADRLEIHRSVRTGVPPAEPRLDGEVLSALVDLRTLDLTPLRRLPWQCGLVAMAGLVRAVVDFQWFWPAFAVLNLGLAVLSVHHSRAMGARFDRLEQEIYARLPLRPATA